MARAAFVAIIAVVLVAASCDEETGSIVDPVHVTEVFDGDSFAIAGDEVRLVGINAPERDECFGDEASDRLADLIAAENVEITVLGDRDQFGRLLAYVTTEEGRDVNETMLEEGLAIALQSGHRQNTRFVGIAADAAGAGVGLWAPDACGPAGEAAVDLGTIEHDPPGPDGDVLNDESIEIVTLGDESVDLTGWTIRDESSSNRLVLSSIVDDRLVVRTGCGSGDEQTIYWCSELPVWSNGGDTAFLLDPNGNIVAWKTYR